MSGPAKFRKNVKISERHGAGEWALERVCLLALMPLGLWVAWTGFSLAGADHAMIADWFTRPANAGLLIATVVIFCTFAALAWKVIVEDYIHAPGAKGLSLFLVNLVFFALAAASVFFIVRLALGSAPLPAGIGA
ncbi:succinate dehydrogenase, hydrophobic membrane anchor protein [Brevundimonas sp. FT23042]|uniref:succinate dehydrogenase, hydrophobic membrane anchor protein n=1 Tax=Brevundimonas sp. FT23042 TaxID=3393749 RepID=UPI003B5881D9